MALLEQMHGAAIQRAMVPYVQYVMGDNTRNGTMRHTIKGSLTG